jgi:multiple sugar transport system substrate-binding protein
VIHAVRKSVIALLAVLALLAGACGGAEESPDGTSGAAGDEQGADEQVELRFSWWGSDVRHELTNQVIEAFEQEHPDISIEGEFTGWDEYWDRLATTVAGGDTPDIIQQESRYLRDYADRGVLANLSEVAPGTVRTDDLDPTVLPTGEVDGALYGVPAGVNAYTVVADPTAFDSADVELPDSETWTWADYVQTAVAVSEATGGDVFGTQDMGYNEAGLQIFARQRGEDLYSEDGLGLSEQTVRDWWQISADLIEQGGTPPESLTAEVQTAGIEQSLLATSRGAMGHWWTNELLALSEMSGQDLQLLRYPGETGAQQAGMFFKPSMFYSVAADTEHPEEAAMFIDFLVNETAAANILLSDRGLPANLQVREEVAGELPETDQQSMDFMAQIEGDLADPPPLPPVGAGEVQEILQRLNDEVVFGRLTAEEAAAQFMSEASSAIGS